jgi:hypothetical protein
MSRLKKIFVSGLMVLVSACAFLAPSMFNISQAFTAYAGESYGNTVPGENTNDSTTDVASGDIITVKNIPTSATKNDTTTIYSLLAEEVKDGDDVVGYRSSSASSSNVNYNSYTVSTSSETGVSSSDVIYVEICDPYGNQLTDWDETTGYTKILSSQVSMNYDNGQGTLSLTPTQNGTYTVQYYAYNTNAIWTNTNTYNIVVTSNSYGIEMQTNDSIVMPTTVRTNENDGDQTWSKTNVEVALPLLYDENGDLITSDIVLGGQQGNVDDGYYYYVINYQNVTSTTLNGATGLSLTDGTINSYSNYKTYTIKKVAGQIADLSTEHYVLYVDVKNSSGTVTNHSTTTAGTLSLSSATSISAETYDVYADYAYSFDALAGKNIVTYKLYKTTGDVASQSPDSYLTYTVTGSTSYDSENIELAATASSTIKATSASYKQKIYLPSVSATNSNANSNSINAFYYYTVQVVTSDDTYSATEVEMGRDENGFYFVPNAASGSKYEIAYNVVDFYGNIGEDNDNYNYTITITDRTSPSVSYVEAYSYYDSTTSAIVTDTTVDTSDYSYIVASNYTVDYSVTKPTDPGDEPVLDDYGSVEAYNTALATYNSAVTALNDYYARLTKVYIPAVYATDESGFNTEKRTLTSDNFLDEDGDSTTATISINDNNGGTSATISNITTSLSDILYFIDSNNNVISYDTFTKTTENDGYGLESGTNLRTVKESYEAVLYLDPTIFGAGDYTLSLTVVDGNYNSNSSTRTFAFTIVDSEDGLDKSAPTVEFGTSTISRVNADETLSVPVPTITDEGNDRYIVKYYALVEDGSSNTFFPLSLDDDEENIVVNMGSASDTTSIYYNVANSESKSFKVVAFVFDGYVSGVDTIISSIENNTFDMETLDEDDNLIGYGAYKISVKYITDSVAPEFDDLSALSLSTVPEQYATSTIAGVTFYDDTPNAKISVSVVDTKGTSYSYSLVSNTTVTKLATAVGSYTYSYDFGGITFTPTNADADNYYTITYTLRDNGNNVVSYSFVLVHASDKEGPTLQGIPGSTVTIELGQVCSLAEITAVDNYSTSITYNVTCKNADGEIKDYYNNIENVFEPEETGTYQITLTAEDENGNESTARTFTIIVEDTLAPTITLDSYEPVSLVTEDEVQASIDTNDGVYPTLTLPLATFADTEPDNYVVENSIGIATSTITITAPEEDSDGVSEYVYDVNGNLTSGDTNVLTFTKNALDYSFIPTARGEYTITYACTDNSGNEATEKTITINVGDTTAPEIVLTSIFKSKLDAGFVIGTNDTLNINVRARIYDEDDYSTEDLYVKDNTDGGGFDYLTESDSDPTYHYVKVSVVITNSSDTELDPTSTTDDVYTFDFDTAGTYTLTFTVSDAVGNEETWTRTIVVSAASSSGVDATTIIGTVLIIISVAILVGVLIYFFKGTKILPKKKMLKKDSKKDGKKDDKDDSKNVEVATNNSEDDKKELNEEPKKD